MKLVAEDGKKRLTDVADTEQLFRLIQSVPSPKAEPFKSWMAQIASERIAELQDPELTIDRAMWEYKRLGYSDSWINQRLKSIEIRKNLTDEWKRCGMEEGVQFASLTDIISILNSEEQIPQYIPGFWHCRRPDHDIHFRYGLSGTLGKFEKGRSIFAFGIIAVAVRLSD